MIIKPLASGSRGNAYCVSDGQTTVLIECGIPAAELQKGTGFNLSRLQGILISHGHNDHCRAIHDCIRVGPDIYAPAEVFAAKGVHGNHCNAVQPFKGFHIGTFFVLPFDCVHDCVNYGYLLHSNHSGGRLIYFTDTCMVKYRFDGLTHIMGECNYSLEAVIRSIELGYIPASMKERLKTCHMSIDSLLEYLRVNDIRRVREIYLLHLSENNSHAENFKTAVTELTGKNVFVCRGGTNI